MSTCTTTYFGYGAQRAYVKNHLEALVLGPLVSCQQAKLWSNKVLCQQLTQADSLQLDVLILHLSLQRGAEGGTYHGMIQKVCYQFELTGGKPC